MIAWGCIVTVALATLGLVLALGLGFGIIMLVKTIAEHVSDNFDSRSVYEKKYEEMEREARSYRMRMISLAERLKNLTGHYYTGDEPLSWWAEEENK